MATRKLEDFKPNVQVLIHAIAKVFFNGNLDAALTELEISSQERRALDAKASKSQKSKKAEVRLGFKSHQ